MVLLEILLKNLTITINFLLEINLMRKTLNCFKYVWQLKGKIIDCFINFDIAMKSEINVRGSLKCDLCDLYFLLQ